MPTSANSFDPELLERYAIIRSSPPWKEVKESMTRLEPLRKPAAKPYDQMDLDRDNVLRYAGILRNSAASIAYGICLAAHLARFSKMQAFEPRLNDGFQALSTGLDLPALGEADTRSELERCAHAAFPDLDIQPPPLQAPVPTPESPRPSDVLVEASPETVDPADTSTEESTAASAAPVVRTREPAADAWRNTLENALAKIREMDPPNIKESLQKASDSWQARLQAFLSGQPDVLPGIDYLRCRASNQPLGMILRGRLRNVSLREWSEAYVAGMSESGVTFPVPLWFSLAALGALGFDIPQDMSSAKSAEERSAAIEFVSKIRQTSPPKGLLILRVTAESQTTGWKISSSMPALIITPSEFLGESKVNLLSYFQPRLNGVLIEVGRDEQPSAALTRADISKIKERLPSVRCGFLMAAQPQASAVPSGYTFAVLPIDAMDAHTKTFATTSK